VAATLEPPAILIDAPDLPVERDDAPPPEKPRKTFDLSWLVLGITIYAIFVYTYMSLRFNGHWSENDTLVLTAAAYSAQNAGSIFNAEFRYTNGSGYVALSVFLSEITGLEQQTLQTYLMPLIAASGAIIVYAAYRAILGNLALVALIATFFVFLQPDFIWVTWRGSHEKLTWLMVFMILFSLTRTFTLNGGALLSFRYMLVFYLCAGALITSNVFFASSFIMALTLSFIGAIAAVWLRQRWLRRTENTEGALAQIRRLVYVTSICLVLLYIYMFFVYPPSVGILRSFDALADQLSLIFLNVEQNSLISAPSFRRAADFNPYSYVTDTWATPQTFIILTSFNWALLGMSFLVWLVNIPRILRLKRLEESALPQIFLWLLYPAFALQLALSLFADRSDAVGGNIQVRLFTPLLLMAVPLSAIGVHAIYTRFHGRLRRAAQVVAVGGVVMFSVFSLLKSINEPLISNNWLFSTTSERVGMAWLTANSPVDTFWTGFDDRLSITRQYTNLDYFLDSSFTAGGLRRYFFYSTLDAQRWQRRGRPMPLLEIENRVYDNGLGIAYHRFARTPYQR
jgi:hypothetical protein